MTTTVEFNDRNNTYVVGDGESGAAVPAVYLHAHALSEEQITKCLTTVFDSIKSKGPAFNTAFNIALLHDLGVGNSAQVASGPWNLPTTGRPHNDGV